MLSRKNQINIEEAVMNYIAERKLLFPEKNTTVTKEIAIKISKPYIIQQRDVKFSADGVVAGCHVKIDGLDGLDGPGFDLYGMDFFQAINLASS